MNRPIMMRFALPLCAALLWACGGDSTTPEPDTFNSSTPDAEDEPDVAAPDVAPEVVDEPDVIPDVVEEPDVAPEVIEEPDVAPEIVEEEIEEGPECVAPIDCITKLSDQFEECETASCDDGTCVIVPIEGCCLADEDCPGFADACCDVITCNLETSQCESEPVEDCCEASYQCNDDDPTTGDFCANACEQDGCVFLPPLCDNDVTYMTEGFNDPTFPGIVIDDAEVFDLVSVSAQQGKTVSPSYSMYFGAPDCQTYYTGSMEGCTPTDFLGLQGSSLALEATLSPVTLAYAEAAYLGFWVRMAAEPALQAGDTLWPTDYLRISVDIGEGETNVVWRSPDALGVENTTHGEWVYQVVDLTEFKGKNVTISLAFIADNVGNFNFGEGEPWYGAYVDDLIIRTACVSCVPGSYCNADFDGCTDDLCVGVHGNPNVGLCTYHAASVGSACQPCAQAGDCGQDECTNYWCVDGYCETAIKSECCEPFSSFPYETLAGAVSIQSFEAIGIDAWTLDDPYPDDNIDWQVTENDAYTGSASLFFGDPDDGDYVADPPNPAIGSAWSPSFQVLGQAGMPTVLSFWLNLSTEYDLGTGPVDPEDSYDMLSVYLHEVGEDPVIIWDSASTLGNSTHGTWQQVGVNVSDWVGKFVRLGFEFDSGDVFGTGYGNEFGGVYVDELTVSVYCETECLSSATCDDGDTCTTNACVFGSCETTQPDPDCCHDDADCAHDNTCVSSSCEEGLCQYAYSQVTSCCSEGSWLDEWATDFESGAGEWTVVESTPPVVWNLKTADTVLDAHSGYHSYNFSDPETGTYGYTIFDDALGVDIGQPTTGQLVSPTISVPPFTAGSPYASFWLRMATEWDFGNASTFEPAIPVDELRVKVATDGNIIGAAELWTSHYLLNTTKGEWAHTYVDLSDYRGQDVQLVFEFVSGDGNFNDHAGAFVDDVSFGTTCKASAVIQCFDGGDCALPDDCTAVVCDEDFSCIYSALNTPQCCEPTDMDGLALTFEDEAEDWEVMSCEESDTSPGVPVDPSSVWKVSAEDQTGGISAKYGEGMLYFGNGFDYGGAAGTAACSKAMSPPITLPESDAPWTLGYWVYLDIEPATDCGQGFAAPWLDVFTLEIVEEDTDDSTLILVKDAFLCTEYGAWAYRSWDMTPWVGKTVRFRVGFNSWDQDANSGKGIALDDIRFERGCADL